MKKERIIARIDSDEKQKVMSFCAKNFLSISDFIRELIAKRDLEKIRIITQKEKEILYNLHYEFQKIGINVNQIAHYFNLEHLKNLNKKNRLPEDLILIDKIKGDQIEEIKIILKEVGERLEAATNNIGKIYES